MHRFTCVGVRLWTVYIDLDMHRVVAQGSTVCIPDASTDEHMCAAILHSQMQFRPKCCMHENEQCGRMYVICMFVHIVCVYIPTVHVCVCTKIACLYVHKLNYECVCMYVY